MTLAEYAKQIRAMVKAGYGKHDVWHSIDDEGNGFQPVNFLPSVIVVNKDGEFIMPEDKKKTGHREVICIN